MLPPRGGDRFGFFVVLVVGFSIQVNNEWSVTWAHLRRISRDCPVHVPLDPFGLLVNPGPHWDMEPWGFVLVVEVEAVGSLVVGFFVVHEFVFEAHDAVMERGMVGVGVKLPFCDGGEEAFTDLSEDVGWEVLMVGQGCLYSTRRHGRDVRGWEAGRWDWEWRVGSFDGRFV